MDSDDTPEMFPLFEGSEATIQQFSQRLKAQDIPHTVEITEDCQPGS